MPPRNKPLHEPMLAQILSPNGVTNHKENCRETWSTSHSDIESVSDFSIGTRGELKCQNFQYSWLYENHYNDVIMSLIASQITSLTIVYSTVSSDADQRKHQSSASLAFVRGIHRGPVNSPHKWPVTRKMFPFDDVIMWLLCIAYLVTLWYLGKQGSRRQFDHVT